VLVLADLSRHDREWVRERLADQWLGFEKNELEVWLADAGFADVKCGRVTGTLQEEVVLVLRAA